MAVEPDSAGARFPPPLVYPGALLLGLAAKWFAPPRSFGIDWRFWPRRVRCRSLLAR